jgi:hypothetical protein
MIISAYGVEIETMICGRHRHKSEATMTKREIIKAALNGDSIRGEKRSGESPLKA